MINQYIRQYGKRLYGLCLTLCANTFDADDLYQDTWLKVVKSISQYDATQPFEPWLTQICVNTYRNTLRRIMRSPIFNSFAKEVYNYMSIIKNEIPILEFDNEQTAVKFPNSFVRLSNINSIYIYLPIMIAVVNRSIDCIHQKGEGNSKKSKP